MAIPGHNYSDQINKFGEIPDFDAANTNEDVWDYTGAYPFPAAAATTTIVSDSAEDDTVKADTNPGTGAWTVQVIGLDTNYLLTTEVATLNGAGAVTLDNEYLRVFRVKVLTSGSGETNAGNIDVKHGATVIARIQTALGQTLMAIYTVPANYQHMHLQRWYAAMTGNVNGSAVVSLQVREYGGSWQTKMRTNIALAQSWLYDYGELTPTFPAKADIRVRVNSASVNNSVIAAGFDGHLHRS